MNMTFLTWLTVAAVVGGALLMFLGMPGSEQATPLLALEPLTTEEAATASQGAYWEPVASGAARSATAPVVMQAEQPCSHCGAIHSTSTASGYVWQEPVPQPQIQPCTACGATPAAYVQQTMLTQPCGSCGAGMTSSGVPIYMQYPQQQMASCEQRVPSPCGPVPCSGLPMTCVSTCDSTCPVSNPGINRNMALCVEECTFVQFHTTIPHPICSDVRFEWTTSKGSFLESHVPDPIYYVPMTQFAGGEDVWVVLKITDSRGVTYTDQLKLHVINQR